MPVSFPVAQVPIYAHDIAPPLKKKGKPYSHTHRGGTGSANNSWISWVGSRKSLIPEEHASTSWGHFSTSQPFLSTSLVFALRRFPPLYLSLKLLKRKGKVIELGVKQRGYLYPRVRAVFPRVSATAQFLIHESAMQKMLTRGNSWMTLPLFFKALTLNQAPSTNPRVALPVLPFSALRNCLLCGILPERYSSCCAG